MKIKLIVFDLDGTLADTFSDIAASANDALTRLGRPELPEPVVRSYVGDGIQTFIARLLPDTSEEERSRALDLFREHHEAHLLDRTVLYPGVAEGLARLAPTPRALLSNKPERWVRRILQGLGIASEFGWIKGGDSFGTRKPDPEGLQAALRWAAAVPGEALLVGDSLTDARTAAAAGVRFVAVSYGHDGPSELAAAGAVAVVDRLTELETMMK